ncbi:Type 1 glutamine amidotransferase-like domain-containing protein [Paenibacillus lautus]|uniref:Type 1 glutamine amidotransferase-like domain-containing protein n=1 Tax=Paenibacillus lautus TaxID=1401 RepID=UPI002DB88BA9|nr:Type 1 glutamine amidotransferase-like domain-containing protein [Paenibacillus lautus]MEC0203805.1 Type 1 glutamine amidotransferase-like domain-containing protein [Paenibacillus lautus]
MLKLFLTSSFKDVVDHFREFVADDLKGRRLTFIPTASIPEEITHYIHTAKEAFERLGVVVEELDISAAPSQEIKEKLERNDFIYVSGGNTFYLLQELRKSGADKIITDQVHSGKLYIGESAGSIITSPNIEYVKFMDDIGKATTLKSYEGLNFINVYPVPHYNNEPFKDAASDLMAHYNSKLNLVPISNTQVIQVEKNKIVVR